MPSLWGVFVDRLVTSKVHKKISGATQLLNNVNQMVGVLIYDLERGTMAPIKWSTHYKIYIGPQLPETIGLPVGF